jgi:hypothetical protein
VAQTPQPQSFLSLRHLTLRHLGRLKVAQSSL